MKKTLIVAAVAASFASVANAQSSVTLYGLLDAGFSYTSNSKAPNTEKGSAANFRLASGNLNGSRWGMRGQEDLGGGLKAIFTLESGFSMGDGTAGQGGRQFGRQAYAGLSSANAGTVTLGRQYDSVVDYLGPVTATGSWGGQYFAHIGDNDNAYDSFRVNNSVKYQSANYGGVTFGGLYGFSNQAGGFANNRAYSAGAQYANGPIKLAAAYMQLQGATDSADAGNVATGSNVAGAVTEAMQASQTQRTFGGGGSYAFGPATVGLVYTQSRFEQATGGAPTTTFNNYELNAHYALTPALALGAAYTYTSAKNYFAVADSGSDKSHYHQVGLQADYSLSKRTDVYAEGVVQLASKNTTAVEVYGSGGAATHGNQVVVTTGMRHRF